MNTLLTHALYKVAYPRQATPLRDYPQGDGSTAAYPPRARPFGPNSVGGYNLGEVKGSTPYTGNHFKGMPGIARSMEQQGHPFQASRYFGDEKREDKDIFTFDFGARDAKVTDRRMPWVYDKEGWRKPLLDVQGRVGAHSTPRDYRDLADRMSELRRPMTVDARAENQGFYFMPEDPQQTPHTAFGRIHAEAPGMSIGATDTQVGTHEHQHALDNTHRGMYDMLGRIPNFLEREQGRAGVGKNVSIGQYETATETPAVMAETVASLRNLDQRASHEVDSLRFGAPGYNQASGRFIHDQGSRYMYGRNPYTDEKVTPQRSMSELLTRPEGRQWLDRMGRESPASKRKSRDLRELLQRVNNL